MTVQEWVDAYGAAWRAADPEAAARLFTEDAVYRSSPFRKPNVGTAGVRAYWAKATKDQRNLDLRFGAPFVDAEGRRAAVEWWAVMDLADGSFGTLPGGLYLIFAPDGRCRELREYWHWQEVRQGPPDGWGT